MISWPIGNMGPSLPNLLSTVAGNLFELQQLSALRLVELTLPDEFRDAYLELVPYSGFLPHSRLSTKSTCPYREEISSTWV